MSAVLVAGSVLHVATSFLSITCMAIAPRGDRIAIGSSDGRISVLDLTTSKSECTLECGPAWPTSLAWSGDTRILAASVAAPRADGKTRSDVATRCMAWELATGAPVLDEQLVRSAPPERLDCGGGVAGLEDGLAFGPHGRVLASWGADMPLHVFDVEHHTRRGTLNVERTTITCAAWTADPVRIVTGDSSGAICAWDPTLCTLESRFEWSADPVWSIAVVPQTSRVVAGGNGPALVCWDVRDSSRCWSMDLLGRGNWLDSEDRVDALAIDAAHERVVFGTGAWGSVQMVDLPSATVRWSDEFDGGNGSPLRVVASPDGQHVASWGRGCCGSCGVFDARDGRRRAVDLDRARQTAGSVGWTADSRYLVVLETDVIVFDGHDLDESFRLWLRDDGWSRYTVPPERRRSGSHR